MAKTTRTDKKPEGPTMKQLAEGVYERGEWRGNRWHGSGVKVIKWWEPDGNGDGRRRQETLPPGTTLAQAKAYKGEKEKSKQKAVNGKRSDTCDNFAQRWPDDYPRPEETTNMYNRERVKKFSKDFAGRDLRDIDQEDALRWALAHMGHVKAVKAMFSDAVKYGYADVNPFLVVKIQQQRGRKDIVVLTESEVEQLVKIAHDIYGWYGAIVGGLIGTAAWTGMRPGELYALTNERYDFDAGTIEIFEQFKTKTGKTGKLKTETGSRTIALLPQAEEILRAVPPHPAAETTFYTKKGARFTGRVHHYYWDPVRKAFWNALPKSRREADPERARQLRKIPPDFDFYELRHFFGTYLHHELGASAADIARQMGHKDGGRLAQELYIHTEEDESNARIRELAKQRLAAQRIKEQEEQKRRNRKAS